MVRVRGHSQSIHRRQSENHLTRESLPSCELKYSFRLASSVLLTRFDQKAPSDNYPPRQIVDEYSADEISSTTPGRTGSFEKISAHMRLVCGS